MIRSPSR